MPKKFAKTFDFPESQVLVMLDLCGDKPQIHSWARLDGVLAKVSVGYDADEKGCRTAEREFGKIGEPFARQILDLILKAGS